MVRLDRITDAQREMIIDFGAFLYEPEKMAAILGADPAEIETLMRNNDSDFKKLYEMGKHRADYVLDKKLMELANQGDLKAIEQIKISRRINSKK